MSNAETVLAHRDANRRCLTCWENGAPFDGPCDGCGYADPRWVGDEAMHAFDEYQKAAARVAQEVGE